MDFKKINPLWNLADILTVSDAAALIAGVEPNSVDSSGQYFRDRESGLTDSGGIGPVNIVLSALANSINAGRLKAIIRRNARMQAWDEFPNVGESIRELYPMESGEIRQGFEPNVIYCEAPDWGKTTIDRQDLVNWLRERGFTTGFFFPNVTSDTPNYLDPENLRYAPKLAAAVRAWQAVTEPNGKHPKQALQKWLRENAATFRLTKDDGNPNETGIEEVAKVANWEPGGGAPKTPSA
ncbi:Uncharacterized protein MCB1EB_2237 [Mycoavidus cysteinexigens]|uniref:Uncharacterized protein n=1 Tax=Mycoavidus cysteinexigens TaxID=1553431 RepID=A0A2Z6EYE9_9BURK|nr:hypothetical protein [Mycoavidus cysteinexigens]BBE10398.1 Uncharacterized protein MCB1EB_2237 [Mycoavidus cysteinexigens]GAM53225.1 hypothetical protein EBME_1688 [bacterium endosymbiont of Mortierella elongata FMR23-6]GLR00436.1 hypothetical protein GCM10007934_02470 [Mycoavidus cysteinexigens]